MENIRLVLVILLSFIALLLWEEWQRDYSTPALATTAASAEKGPGDVPAPAAAKPALPTAGAVPAPVTG